jgi:hypothetical protein
MSFRSVGDLYEGDREECSVHGSAVYLRAVAG